MQACGLGASAGLVQGSCRGSSRASDEDELLARVSAVLKSQGHRKLAPWETRSPLGSQSVNICALSETHHLAGKIAGETREGVASYDATSPGCVWYSFQFANGGENRHYK